MDAQRNTSAAIASNVPSNRAHGNGSSNRRESDSSSQMQTKANPRASVRQSPSAAGPGYIPNSRMQGGHRDASNAVSFIDSSIK